MILGTNAAFNLCLLAVLGIMIVLVALKALANVVVPFLLYSVRCDGNIQTSKSIFHSLGSCSSCCEGDLESRPRVVVVLDDLDCSSSQSRVSGVDTIKYGTRVLGGDVDTCVADEDGSFSQVATVRSDDQVGVS